MILSRPLLLARLLRILLISSASLLIRQIDLMISLCIHISHLDPLGLQVCREVLVLSLIYARECDGCGLGQAGHSHIEGARLGHACAHASNTRELNELDLSKLDIVNGLVDENE